MIQVYTWQLLRIAVQQMILLLLERIQLLSLNVLSRTTTIIFENFGFSVDILIQSEETNDHIKMNMVK